MPGLQTAPKNSPSSIGVLRWQPLSCLDVFCELQSPLESVLERAELLLGARRSTPDSPFNLFPESQFAQRWRVTRDEPLAFTNEEKARPWRVENLVSGATLHCKNHQQALTSIEYATVQSLVDRVKSDHVKSATENHRSVDSVFALHGALLCKDGFGVVVVGPSESGKSTLSCALWQNGWSLLSDDFCFFQNENRAFPAPRRVSLRGGSRALIGEEIWARIQNAPSSFQTEAGWLFHPHELEAESAAPDARAGGVLVQAFVFLGRRTSEATSVFLQRHNPALAAMAILPYCTLLPRVEDGLNATISTAAGVLDWGAALPRIAPVAARVPVYDLGRGPLPEMIAAVETLTATPKETP